MTLGYISVFSDTLAFSVLLSKPTPVLMNILTDNDKKDENTLVNILYIKYYYLLFIIYYFYYKLIIICYFVILKIIIIYLKKKKKNIKILNNNDNNNNICIYLHNSPHVFGR